MTPGTGRWKKAIVNTKVGMPHMIHGRAEAAIVGSFITGARAIAKP
jgi:hypothetical protein